MGPKKGGGSKKKLSLSEDLYGILEHAHRENKGYGGAVVRLERLGGGVIWEGVAGETAHGERMICFFPPVSYALPSSLTNAAASPRPRPGSGVAMTTSAQFEVASITKAMTSAAVLKARFVVYCGQL